MTRPKKLFIAGHRGMVGKALVRRYQQDEDCTIVTATRNEVDLTRQKETEDFFRDNEPDTVIVAAAKVGGIHANNTEPADFIYDNLGISLNVIDAAFKVGVTRLLFLASSCAYPRLAEQPMSESALLTGPLEPTNEAYAIAKIAGIKLCQFYRRQHGALFHSAMPTNLYGPGDNYDPSSSHAIPALILRIHQAKMNGDPEVAIWGTGTPRREFLHVDDAADACHHLLAIETPEDWINVGTGKDIAIIELAQKIALVVGYPGKIIADTSRPDGSPRKLLNVEKIHRSGWNHKTELDEGLAQTYQDFLTNELTAC